MTRAINEDYINKIKALEKDKPNVSCMLCHRGREDGREVERLADLHRLVGLAP